MIDFLRSLNNDILEEGYSSGTRLGGGRRDSIVSMMTRNNLLSIKWQGQVQCLSSKV